MTTLLLRCLLAAWACALTATSQAQSRPSELPGAKDHPIVSRFKSSVLQNASSESFASLRIPKGRGEIRGNDVAFEKSLTAEGAIHAYYYVQPPDTPPLEVLRNYQQALTQAGFEPVYACELEACAFLAEHYRRELLGARRWRADRGSPSSGSTPRLRYWSGKAARDGVDFYAIVWVEDATSQWGAPTTSVVLVEPKPMATGQVTVSLDQLKKGLENEGKIALYGLYFDTGKADIKPESAPQLSEMAKLLKADPALRVFIVGHTDNEGTLDGNLTLSHKRAEAVAAALTRQHGIDAGRLTARGVANYAPLASNAGETGRAKNRRVELVAR